jgi:protein phosphatase
VITAAARTHVGLARTSNEDAYICNPERGFFAVADGMGGYVGGEVASSMTVEALGAMTDVSPASVGRAIRATSEAIMDRAFDDDLDGMGSTVVTLTVNGDEATVVHAGDSRCYVFGRYGMEQVGRDHSLVASMLASGFLTPEQARTHKQRHVVTSVLGYDGMRVDVNTTDVAPEGCRFLLCSDGLNDMVDGADIGDVMGSAMSPDEAADTLIALALAAGGSDNVTVIVVWVSESE